MIPMDRAEFYAEQIAAYKEGGKPTRAVDIIDVFIFNSDGEILIQKRSYNKTHNPGLLDKSIGGHITYDDNVEHSVMVETVQELQTPSIVLRSVKDFNKTFTVLNSYLETVAIIKHGASEIFHLTKIIQEEEIVIANKAHLFFGVYDGRIRPVDKEAKGVLYYTLDELLDEMKKFPETFAHDMHFFIEKYEKEMREFVEFVKR